MRKKAFFVISRDEPGLQQVHENLHGNVKRLDSLMVASRCKSMSRLEIIFATTANAVRLMDRLGCRELIIKELEHYRDKDDYNATVYYCKGDDVGYSESQFCMDYIDQKDGDAPETTIADGAYGGTENQELF